MAASTVTSRVVPSVRRAVTRRWAWRPTASVASVSASVSAAGAAGVTVSGTSALTPSTVATSTSAQA